jgi:septum site-determining protein MinC
LATRIIDKSKNEAKPPISVKGVKEGLLFLLDENCEFETLLEKLRDMLDGDLSTLFSGPDIGVFVDYGTRAMTKSELNGILEVFLAKENFLLKEWGSDTQARRSLLANRGRGQAQNIYKKTVRAGQQLTFDGDVVIVGDVNPGGEIIATGDIYVFGKLAGIAHAGARGDMQAIIGAAEFAPMQLRIADVVTRAPEVNGRAMNTFMEFAYLRDEGMAVDRMSYAPSIRAALKVVDG